jgi:hypothetical protein
MRLLSIPTLLACTGAVAAATIRVPEDVKTIQGAIDAARSGDRIAVAAGTYRETIRLTGQALVLDAVDGPSRTVIDATELGQPVITCVGSSNGALVIRGFRLTGGTGDTSRYGATATVGGGMVLRGASPLIENCRLMGNVVSYEGGGVWAVEHATPRFIRCIFSSNRADRGGAVFLHDSDATFLDCRFISDHALFAGGGIVADAGSRLQVSDCRFEGCHAAYNGGGVYVYDSSASLDRCVFIQNSAGLSGGAVYQGYHAKVEMEEIDFRTIGDTVFGQWHADVAPPKGACCIQAICIEVTSAACIDAGGLWSGAETDCIAVAAAACPVPRPGDLNDDRAVDIRDVAILMSLWGDQRARSD